MISNIVLRLNNLDCANCGNKIEVAVRKIKGVADSNVVFVKEEIIIEYDENIINKDSLMEEVKKIAKRIEYGIVVELNDNRKKQPINKSTTCSDSCCSHDHSHSHEKHSHSHDHIHTHDNCNCDEISQKEIKKEHSHEHGGDIDNKRITIFVFGIALYIGAIFIDKTSVFRLPTFLIAYILLGGDVIVRAIKNITRGDFFDENFLMSISTIGAFFIGDYIEGVAVMLFYQIGEFFSDLAVDKSRKSIKELMNIKPEYANIEKNGQIITVQPEEVSIGDIIVVKPGEKIPLDGSIIEGSSQLDVSALIGESVPKVVKTGEEVLSGSINIIGLLKIKVTKDYSNSTVTRIMDMVENASTKKAPVEKFITRFSRIYTPVVVFAAIFIGLVPPILLSAPFANWIRKAIVFLVISCPCALVISVPLTFFSGIGTASKKGILIKGGNYLQALSEAETVVFDKTGTLTEGIFEVSKVITAQNINKSEVLETAYAIESYSNHPIAKSIVDYCNKENYNKKQEIDNFEEISGFGLKANINKKTVLAGNAKLLKTKKIDFEEYKGSGTIVYISKNDTYIGAIIISDKIKKDSKIAMQELKNNGIKKLVMLTGDRKTPAEEIAKDLNLDKVYYELLPDQKIEKIEELYDINPESKIIFVGDGINDAPVLTRADVGIAMGGVGSSAAIEAADVVLMTDEPSKVSEAIQISKNTVKIAKQNIIFALAVKSIILVLGAFDIASMWMAVFADVGVTLIAVLNSMRNK